MIVDLIATITVLGIQTIQMMAFVLILWVVLATLWLTL